MKKEFIVNRQGRDFALYAGLLDQAHREGLKRITTKLLQAPSEENGQLAICWAEVETEKGVFTGIGDASPQNVGRMIAMHTVRMSETRAKARALRDAINVGVTALEELADVEEDSSIPSRLTAPRLDSRANVTTRSAPIVEQPALAATSAAERLPTTALRPMPTPEPTTSAGPATPATQQQIDRLHKLQAALGRPTSLAANLTSEEAAAQISELVRTFNAQSRGGRTQVR